MTPTSPKPLFIPLAGQWFDKFASGEKTEEYRLAGGRWNQRTCHPGRLVVLSRGYGKQHRLSGVITAFRRSRLQELPYSAICAVIDLYGESADIHGIAVISIEVQR